MLWNAKNGTVPAAGSEMAYVSFGRGEKVLILLPGLSDGLASVKGKALLLAKPYKLFFDEYTVYMFSRKDALQEGCTIREMAADQAEALRNLGIHKVSVMGVSEGGMIAQYLAIDHPELMEKLVLAVTAPKVNDTVRARIGAWTAYAKAGDHRQLMIDTAENSYSVSYLRNYRRIYPFIGALGKPKDYGRFFANCAAILGFDASEELPEIQCPTLIIGGADDRIVGPDAAKELKALIPGSALYVYEGLGHAAYEEARDFNRRVYRFLERGET